MIIDQRSALSCHAQVLKGDDNTAVHEGELAITECFHIVLRPPRELEVAKGSRSVTVDSGTQQEIERLVPPYYRIGRAHSIASSS